MAEAKRKIFPKLKRSFSNFLTDESGEMTKKDAVTLGIGAVLVASVENVTAGYNNEGYRDWWGNPVCNMPVE